MPTFTTNSEYEATPDAFFAFVVNLANWPTFRGFGPLPGIVRAEVEGGGPIRLGSRVRVTNTDGSVHVEDVTAFEPPHRYAMRMEVAPPASRLFASIDEDLELAATTTGTHVRRRFTTRPRSRATAPLVFLVTHLLLRPAVRRHDRDVRAALARPRS